VDVFERRPSSVASHSTVDAVAVADQRLKSRRVRALTRDLTICHLHTSRRTVVHATWSRLPPRGSGLASQGLV
jgi:hypothetical protein